MDQFLRSAIDLSDIEAKVLSGGYESDSGYSTYDVSPITSSAPAQLSYPTSSQLASIQTHGHHVEQTLFSVSPTATMFPVPPAMNQPSTSLLHDTMHSPCSSDVGFFSPHSGFSSHATTPSHQDAFSFFPAQGACPMFTSYPQHQDFNSLNMSTCFPDGGVSNTDSTIPTFSSQIPDILLPDTSLASVPLSMPTPPASAHTTESSVMMATFPKSESVVHTACKEEPQPLPKPVENSAPKQTAESATEVKGESRPNSCAFASRSETLKEGQVKMEHGEEDQSTADVQAAKSSQAILSKLLGQANNQPTIVSITAINNNGTTTKLDLSQLQALVSRSPSAAATASSDKTKASSHSGSVSDSESTNQGSPLKSKLVTSSPKAVPMKATQRKKGQWPRSMSKANLMAFREHILNKLKKGQETSNGATNGNISQKETSEDVGKVELMKCETPSPTTSCEVNVTYERNRSAESRCHSEPAEMFGGPNSSPSLSLQPSHSESYLHSSTTAQQQVFGPSEADTKLADFFPQNCNDVLNLFQFNPDALLSTTIDDHFLDGIDLSFDEEDSCKVDNEIARFLDSEVNGTSSESPMEISPQYDVLRDNSPVMTPPLSHHASPLISPATYNSCPSSPQKSLQQHCGYNSVSPTTSRPYLPERALITGHVTTGPMSSMQAGMFNFPDMLAGRNKVGGVACDTEMKLHIQQNLLQSHYDPLLTGSGTILQVCGSETIEF